MTPYLQVIAQEWIARAEELAQWAFEHMVNRTDVWGSYLASDKRRRKDMLFFTAPFPAARGKEFLTKGMLAKHFSGLDGCLLSLHSTSADRTSRWLGIDIDRHDNDETSNAESNLAAAIAWHDKLAELGFDPLLMDSNGNGGFHVLTLFADPAPTGEVFALGQSMVAEWEKRGLPRKPETYPKQVSTEEGHFGNCLRLFGRHHTREHFTRVWSGEAGEAGGAGLAESWLEGAGAIDRILQTRLVPPSLIPHFTPSAKAMERERPETKVSRKQRPRVCVDLDGVLAGYDGWKGLDFTGQPIPGAAEFTRKLSEFADVVVFTTRCSVEPHRTDLNEPTRPASDLAPRLMHNVRYWLEKYKFSFTEIYAGQGKPIASAYIDDRAVACLPQTSPQAFAMALQRARELCSSSREAPPKAADPRLSSIISAWPGLSEDIKGELLSKATGNAQPDKPKTRGKRIVK